jgi:hypothetical protein
MNRQRNGRNTGTGALWALILLALLYLSLVVLIPTLTGISLLDGSIGVVLGLFICSRPAGNAVDMLFYERGAFRRLTSGWAGIGWLALNLLVLLVGWLVIVSGAMRFAGRAL